MTLGVEEEFLIVDQVTGELVGRAGELFARRRRRFGDDVAKELNLCQIEIGTPVCTDLAGVRAVAHPPAAELDAAAVSIGTRIAATATHPFGSWRDQTHRPRHRALQPHGRRVPGRRPPAGHRRVPRARRRRRPRAAGRDHEPGAPVVAGDGRVVGELAVLAGRRHRVRQLPPADLAALADLGHAAPARLGRRVRRARRRARRDGRHRGRDLHLLVRAPVGAVPDGRVPCLRRVPRSSTRPWRSRVWCARSRGRAAATRSRAGPSRPTGREALGAAMWRAARYGLGRFVDLAGQPPRDRGRREVLQELLEHVRDGLDVHGDRDEVDELVARGRRTGGNGATVSGRRVRRTATCAARSMRPCRRHDARRGPRRSPEPPAGVDALRTTFALRVELSDEPSSLARVAAALGRLHVNILDIDVHETDRGSSTRSSVDAPASATVDSIRHALVAAGARRVDAVTRDDVSDRDVGVRCPDAASDAAGLRPRGGLAEAVADVLPVDRASLEPLAR